MSNKNSAEMDVVAGDLYGEIWISEYSAAKKVKYSIKDYLPGLILVAVAGVTATWLAEHYRMPVILGGLLIGLALNFVSTSPKVHLGLDVCSSSLLRWGIVLLGTQITAAQISSLGLSSFVALIVIMAMVILTGMIGARLASQSTYVGLLIGGATAICGASAALAIYALIGRDRLSQAQFTLSLVGIALASAIGMSFYPILASASGFSDQQAGFLMGAAIHDVAQSLGGGYSFSQGAGEYATIVKLSRVALLAPVIALIGLAIPSENGKRPSLLTRLKLPWFVLAFFAVVILNSVITLPVWVQQYGLIASKTMLLCAVAATAMRSRLDALVSQGWRPLVPVVLAATAAFCGPFGFAWSFL
jgi:uncharacterized integral membrane protein (TIGR00698 family)